MAKTKDTLKARLASLTAPQRLLLIVIVAVFLLWLAAFVFALLYVGGGSVPAGAGAASSGVSGGESAGLPSNSETVGSAPTTSASSGLPTSSAAEPSAPTLSAPGSSTPASSQSPQTSTPGSSTPQTSTPTPSAPGASLPVTSRPESSAPPTSDVPLQNGIPVAVNIRDYGAVGNGTADDTGAFRDALNVARSQGLPLYLPAGTYRLTSTVSLTTQTVVGYSTDNWPADAGKLPTILLDHSRDGFVTSNAAISGVHITYKNTPGDSRAVYVQGTGTRISNVRISNAYNGIIFAEATSLNPGRSNVENVIMENIQNIGMYVSGTMDVPYVGNVSVSGSSAAFRSSGIAFKLAQNDDIRMIGCSATGANVGYQFEDLSDASSPKVTRSTWGSLIDCTAQDVNIGIRVTSTRPTVMMQPLTLNRMTISARTNAVLVDASRMQMTLVSSTLTASSGNAVLLRGGDGLIFFNSILRSQGAADAVRIQKTGNAIFNSCTISSAGGRGIVIDNYAHKGLVIVSNDISSSGAEIVDNAPASVQKAISGNV